MTSALIVGAGIGGLSAAIALGRHWERIAPGVHTARDRRDLLGTQGAPITVYEQSGEMSEVGAGIQLGPNVTRILGLWGLGEALQACAFEPKVLEVRSAARGHEIARLGLGKSFRDKYGSPYLCVHRADLHALLFAQLTKDGVARVALNHAVEHVKALSNGLQVSTRVQVVAQTGHELSTQPSTKTPTGASPATSDKPYTDQRLSSHHDLLIAADGVWSRQRALLDEPTASSGVLGKTLDMCSDMRPGQGVGENSQRGVHYCGNVAYRSLVLQKMLPPALRLNTIRVWLGTDLHLVQYPVRGGEWLNSVLIINCPPNTFAERTNSNTEALQGERAGNAQWRLSLSPSEIADHILQIYPSTCSLIQDTLRAVDNWSAWPLMCATPLDGPHAMVKGRVALLGDAAHPMLPFLAQGAGMAIEDAFELGMQLEAQLEGRELSSMSTQSSATSSLQIEQWLMRYAQKRWQRNARVQQRALLNARLFHARAPLAWARDRALGLLGERLLDMPWLYGYRA